MRSGAANPGNGSKTRNLPDVSTLNGTTTEVRTPTLRGFATFERPGTAQEVAELLREAGELGRTVVPVGSGDALQLGNPAPVNAIGLSTLAMNNLIDYQPTDMTLSVGAGITLADVQAVIGVNGQSLPIEAVNPEKTTIGGLLATALSGPRRYGGGTLRDVLIGIAIAYADGTVGKAGGLVVKNVSGFDMMRLHYGALGTLGVIVSANFKVLPTIRNEFTAEWTFGSLDAAQQTADALRNPLIRPSALTVSRELDGWVIRARFEGRPGGLNAVGTRISDQLGLPTRRDGEQSAEVWTKFMRQREFSDPTEVRVRIGCKPTNSFAVAEHLRTYAGQHGAALTRCELEPGVGLITASWSSGESIDSGRLIESLRTVDQTGALTVLCAPDSVKSDLMSGCGTRRTCSHASLKQEYDPARVLNPGRFTARI